MGGYIGKGMHKYCFEVSKPSLYLSDWADIGLLCQQGYMKNECLAVFQSLHAQDSANETQLKDDLRALVFAQYWLENFKRRAVHYGVEELLPSKSWLSYQMQFILMMSL